MTGCSKLRKAECLDRPQECAWITGNGCQPRNSNASKSKSKSKPATKTKATMAKQSTVKPLDLSRFEFRERNFTYLQIAQNGKASIRFNDPRTDKRILHVRIADIPYNFTKVQRMYLEIFAKELGIKNTKGLKKKELLAVVLPHMPAEIRQASSMG